MTRKIIGLAALGAIVALFASVPAYGFHQLPAGSVGSASSASSGTSHVGRDVAIGVVGVFALMLVAMGVTVPSRSHRFTTA